MQAKPLVIHILYSLPFPLSTQLAQYSAVVSQGSFPPALEGKKPVRRHNN